MNHRPRHAAPGRAAKIAGSVALGAIAAPAALLAVTGTASAAELPDLDGNRLSLDVDGASFEASGATDLLALPEAPALDGLPGSDVLGTDALTGADLASVGLLPGVSDLLDRTALPEAADDEADEADDEAADEDAADEDDDERVAFGDLPGADDLPGLPGTDELPVSAQLDWRTSSEGSTADLLPSTDVFSAADLVDGLI